MAPDLSTFRFVKDDGGRAAAGFRGKARDCAARAIAKTTGLPYRTIWDDIAAARKQSGIDLGMKLRVSADHGINSHREWFHRYMKQLGFRRVIPRTKMKFCADDLPMKGRLVVVLSGHLAAVIDGVYYDDRDYSGKGGRWVQEYYVLAKKARKKDSSNLHGWRHGR